MDFSKLFSLEGRVAVITGGSRGIGRMLAEGFLAAGCAKVYITARKAAVVEETARELGDRVIALPGDISTLAGIEALAASTRVTELAVLNLAANQFSDAAGRALAESPHLSGDLELVLRRHPASQPLTEETIEALQARFAALEL